MPSKRPFQIEKIGQFQSKKFKMAKAIEECMKNKPIVKLINIDDKINISSSWAEGLYAKLVSPRHLLNSLQIIITYREKTPSLLRCSLL